ncbi:MAG TPA: ADP-ribosylglycohydrolase family protein [Candidatus Limnocylindria bacterium]|nr:ADP-ribosylglycohydrolase family protein [Candidatus Limnocylindria bacterium]
MSPVAPSQNLPDGFAGVLLGTAIGDALGLPAENLSPDRIRKWWRGEWRMRLLFGQGLISDDTEHTLMVAQALLTHPEDAVAFQRSLAWKLRWWFVGLPGGVGLATAKACLRLWLGFPAHRAAVRSAGSGPAMRSAILGAYFAHDPDRRRAFVAASTGLTHRSWQAETAAQAVAECAALTRQSQGQPQVTSVLATLRSLSPEAEWQTVLSRIESGLAAQGSVAEFACTMGLERGVTGYALHVVPVAIFAWLRHPDDFRTALTAALDCGGDTDTVGAILGALCGAAVGKAGIPAEWSAGLWEWPRSVSHAERIATQLAAQAQSRSGQALGPVRYFWPGLVPRNLLFFVVVLVHGFRRLAPPY